MNYVLAILLVGGTITLLYFFGAEGRTWVEVSLLAGSLLPAIIKNTPWLYLALSKAKFFVLNTPSTWELSVRFEKTNTREGLPAIAHEIIKRFPTGNVISSTSNRIVLRASRHYVIQLYSPLRDSLGEEVNSIDLSIEPINIGYRDSQRFIHEIINILDEVRSICKADWEAYTLTIELPGENPFFGLYVQQLGSVSIKEFNVKIQLPWISADSRFNIGKSSLTVVSDTVSGFKRATEAALAFKVPEV